MTISPTARLITSDRTTQEQVNRFILAKPHGAYTDNDVWTIAGYYLDQAPIIQVDPLLAIAQMILETGNLTAWWAARPRCNPAGIGVTDAPRAGVSFGAWHASVPAHLGRLVAYATLPDDRTAVQRAAVLSALRWRPLPTERQGVAPTLSKLTGTWATDPTYGDKIARVATAILGA